MDGGNLEGDPIGIVRPQLQPPLESVVSSVLLARLSNHFIVDTEVEGVHFTGKTVYIDAVLRPKPGSGWRDPNACIGLEIKRGTGAMGEASKQISQAVDYANSKFAGFGYMYVFCFPEPLFVRDRWSEPSRFYNRLCGQLGVGFLTPEYGLSLRLKGHLVWSESQGPVDAKHWSLKRKFGSK